MSIKTYRVTLKTPVFVGNGNRLGPMDLVYGDDRCNVVDIDRLIDELADRPEALETFGSHGRTQRLLTQYRVPLDRVLKYSVRKPAGLGPANVNEMVKDGALNPLIPGTSLKGALRTILFCHLFAQSAGRNPEKMTERLSKVLQSGASRERADEPLDHHLLGRDPNHDLLRGLQVGDVSFKLADLEIVDTRVLTLRGANRHGWKQLAGGRATVESREQATSICCEALQQGARGTLGIKLEDFLFDASPAHRELGFSPEKKALLDGDFARICNDHAKAFIENEKAFFEGCGMEEIKAFYDHLATEVPADNRSFLLHMGWGSGWRGMTGNWLTEDWVVAFRVKFGGMGKPVLCPENHKLGIDRKKVSSHRPYAENRFWCKICQKTYGVKDLSPAPFPKTRKIVFSAGAPTGVLGWLKLEPTNGG